MKIKYNMLILVLVSLLALSGCKSADKVNETATPQSSTGGYPAPDVSLPLVTSPGYPAVEGTPADDKAVNEAGYPAPSNAPVRENASQVQVEILSLAQSEKNPDMVNAHVLVNSLGMVEGFDPFDPEMVGKEIDILLTAADAAGLAAGNVIDLTVSYRGDEWGGGYYGTGISLLK